MRVRFALASQHLDCPAETAPEGRLVLSRLGRGSSAIYCATAAIKFVLDGEERYRVDGVEHVVLPGQFLIVEAGSELIATLPQRTPTTGMCIYLPADDALPHVSLATAGERQAGDEPTGGRAIVLTSAGTALGRHLRRAGQALRANPTDGAASANPVVAGASSFLQATLAEVTQRMDGLASARAATRRDLIRRLDIARGYLHDHDDCAVPLDELGRIAGLSQFHLLRSFSAAFGAPPASFHRRHRLALAAERIATGKLDLTGAADRYGFSDERSFRRAWRAQFGTGRPLAAK